MAAEDQVNPVPLGPFTGLNTVDDPGGTVFQPSLDPSVPTQAALRSAVNVDLDRLGWPRRRQGRTKVRALQDGHALASVGGRLLLADAGTLFEVDARDWSAREIVSGLMPGSAVSFVGAGGEIFWTDGQILGRIGADGAARYFLDNDTFYDGVDGSHTQPGMLECGTEQRSILCCTPP